MTLNSHLLPGVAAMAAALVLPIVPAALVTERDGTVMHIDPSGRQSEVGGAPEVFAQGQGGLLDIALSPDFASDRTVFLTYSQGSPAGAGTSLFRARLSNAFEGGFVLEDGQTIFSGNNKSYGGRHFGSRLAFAPDGTLFMTVGERGDGERAQDTSDHAGSVLRLTRDGQPAPGNPFIGQEGYKPEIWSYGHRNPQSAATHPETGVLWTVEHGARGGDEINIPEAGKNYGWPVISYGRQTCWSVRWPGNTLPVLTSTAERLSARKSC